jgi:NAD(P)-dependent dehydrogenase (short-subunit alcohol dehydrogenase family)
MPATAEAINARDHFSGKVALVTGAGQGIGRAIALTFGRNGARVAVNDINPDTAHKTAAQIEARGGQATAHVMDVSRKMAVQAMVTAIVESWGSLDILINNAGVEPSGALLTFDEYDWDRTLAVNLKGSFLCIQAAARVMKAAGGGVIVNIGSIAGRAHGLHHRAAYTASKTGLLGLTREAARELAADNIRVNAVCPGVIATPMTENQRADAEQMARWQREIPQGRLGETGDVVGLMLFLCSPAAGYITGQAINVDGGKVMS